MVVFVIAIVALCFISLLSFSAENTFGKNKMPVIKTFMALAIILGHLSVRVSSAWIQPFRFWGAPFVSMFFYLGLWDVAEFLIQSWSFLFINYEKDLENRVTVFIDGAIVLYDSKTSKRRVQC